MRWSRRSLRLSVTILERGKLLRTQNKEPRHSHNRVEKNLVQLHRHRQVFLRRKRRRCPNHMVRPRHLLQSRHLQRPLQNAALQDGNQLRAHLAGRKLNVMMTTSDIPAELTWIYSLRGYPPSEEPIVMICQRPTERILSEAVA